MKQRSPQKQLQKEIRNVSDKLDRLESEVKLLLKKMGEQSDPQLDKGLKELREGKGRLFKSLREWAVAMRV